jgi:PAS domain-containing protein
MAAPFRGLKQRPRRSNLTAVEREAKNKMQELYSRIIENINDCIKVLDLDSRVLYMNPRGQTLLEFCDVDEYLGRQ